MADQIEGRTLGRYQLLTRVGRGGMTTVYKSLDMARNRVVALKILSPHIARDPDFKARFEREIEALKKLRHPKIVPILDYGELDSYAYIVMPFYPRGTLQNRLGSSPLDPFEIARVTRDICSALAFAHEHGVVHRDVKASNILIDGEGNALLADFGLARFSDLSVSLTGSALLGTPAFMSPEQCKGVKVDARTDQYSLGVVLYQLFTGVLPFEGETPMAIAVQHINQPLPRPRGFKPDLPEAVEEVIVRALAKDREQRYPSVNEMNRALQNSLRESVDAIGNFVPQVNRFNLKTWIMDRTPLGQPISTVHHWWQHRRPALLTALLLLLLLPTAGYALAGMQPTPTPETRVELVGGDDAVLQATIDALSTEIARGDGDLDPDLVQAAVAATLSAQARAQSGRPTATAGLFATPTPTPASVYGAAAANPPNPTEPAGGGDGDTGSDPTAAPTSSPEPTGPSTEDGSPSPAPTATSGGGGTVPAPTSTKPPAPTNTQPPAATKTDPPPTQPPPTSPPPTNPPPTQPPPPTEKPKAVNPKACKDKPGHPNYCTPSP